MKHYLISNDPFFNVYMMFGFNVRIVEGEDEVREYLNNDDVGLLLITEELF